MTTIAAHRRWPRTFDGESLAFALVIAVAFFVAGRLCLSLPRDAGRITPNWVSNAIALTALLCAPSRRWPLIVALCWVGNLMAGVSAGNSVAVVCVLASFNALEYVGVAVLLRRLKVDLANTVDARGLLILGAAAVGTAVLTGLSQSAILWLIVGDTPMTSLKPWVLGHPLSLLVVTPALMTLAPVVRRGLPVSLKSVLIFALAPAAALLVFSQNRFPILFVVPPTLLLISIELGLGGAAGAVLATAAIAIPATAFGLGPVALSQGDVIEKSFVLQLFLVTTLMSSIPVAALQRKREKANAEALAEAERARCAEAAAAASEARYRVLTDEASDAIGSMNMKGELTFVSPAIVKLTGYTPADLRDADLRRFIAPEDYPAVARNFLRIAVGGEEAAPIEYRFLHKDGRSVWLQANPRLVRDDAGRAVGLVDVIRDVTQRREIEDRLATARSEAEAAANAKADFLANMSHELRTPLSGILGYAELLHHTSEISGESRRHVELIEAAGQHLLSVVNDILEISKLEADGLVLESKPFDLRELLETSLDLVRPVASRKDLALELDAPDRPMPVMGDAKRLQQVLLNLLGNAVKFTPAGSIRLVLDAAPRDGVFACRIAVQDSGVGIAPDRLGTIFKRFEQADNSISRRFGGTGLGLAIAHGLVQRMAGAIAVDSTLGAGSTFTLSLDLPMAVAEPSAGAPALAAPAPVADLSGLRVLLAEDVAINRDLISLFLSPLGVELTLAENGAEAVELAGASPFDVILMDMQMPVMDGLEATRRIRASGAASARTPIIALTANVLPAEAAKCAAAGMDDHLGKPFSAQTITAKLAQWRGVRRPDLPTARTAATA